MSEWNRDIHWRQGHLITSEQAVELGLCHANGQENTLAVVATHDCDLAQPPEREPTVEVIVGHRIGKLDGAYTHSKNLRKLHVAFDGNDPLFAEFEAPKKVCIPKNRLIEKLPRADSILTPGNLEAFQLWLASRYRRSAFPEQFDTRLSMKEHKLSERIKKLLEETDEHISGIFFDVDEGVEAVRTDPDDTYKLDIIILYPAEPHPVESEQVAKKLAGDITKLFENHLFQPMGKWQYIELRGCDEYSEESMTYSLFKQLKKWRFEHMSLAADHRQPVLAE